MIVVYLLVAVSLLLVPFGFVYRLLRDAGRALRDMDREHYDR